MPGRNRNLRTESILKVQECSSTGLVLPRHNRSRGTEARNHKIKEAASRTPTGRFVCMQTAHSPVAIAEMQVLPPERVFAFLSRELRLWRRFMWKAIRSQSAFTLASSLLRKMYCIICTVVTGTCESHRTREGRQADGWKGRGNASTASPSPSLTST